jgi:hypothetical protein
LGAESGPAGTDPVRARDQHARGQDQDPLRLRRCGLEDEREQSANFVTYTEAWGIRDAEGKPVFLRNETLGSAAMESLEGGTRFATEGVAEGGAELHGSFERDGSRHGTFRMMRAGVVSNVGKDGKTPNEKQREKIEHLIREQLAIEGPLTPEAVNEALDGKAPQ